MTTTLTTPISERLMRRLRHEEAAELNATRDAAIQERAAHSATLAKCVPAHNALIADARANLEAVRAAAEAAINAAESACNQAEFTKRAEVGPVERARDRLTCQLEGELRHPRLIEALERIASIRDAARISADFNSSIPTTVWVQSARLALLDLQFVPGDPTEQIAAILASQPQIQSDNDGA